MINVYPKLTLNVLKIYLKVIQEPKIYIKHFYVGKKLIWVSEFWKKSEFWGGKMSHSSQ